MPNIPHAITALLLWPPLYLNFKASLAAMGGKAQPKGLVSSFSYIPNRLTDQEWAQLTPFRSLC